MKKVFAKKLAVLLAAGLLMTGASVSCSNGSGDGGDGNAKTRIAADSLPEPVGPSPVEDGLYGITMGGAKQAVNIAARTIAEETYDAFYEFDTNERTMTMWADASKNVDLGVDMWAYTFNDNTKSFSAALKKTTMPRDMDAYINAVKIEEWKTGDGWDYEIYGEGYKGSWDFADYDEVVDKFVEFLFSDTFSRQAPNSAAKFHAVGKQEYKNFYKEMWNEIQSFRYTKDTNGVVTLTSDEYGETIILTPLK